MVDEKAHKCCARMRMMHLLDDARQEGLLALFESTSVEDRIMDMLRREQKHMYVQKHVRRERGCRPTAESGRRVTREEVFAEADRMLKENGMVEYWALKKRLNEHRQIPSDQCLHGSDLRL
jgi:hypothetical protein